jgi:hypothetical protein
MIFENSRKYDISLNPKKLIFGIDKGKLLGNVVLEEGISINPKIIESIKNIHPPTNKKSLQSFFGKIKFIRIFVPKFVEKAQQMNSLLRNDVSFKWDNDSLKSFEDIKEIITMTLVTYLIDL